MPLIPHLPDGVTLESGPVRVRRASRASRKIERRFGMSRAVADLVAELAGLGTSSREAR